MRSDRYGWFAAGKGVLVTLALMVIGYQIVNLHAPPWPPARDTRPPASAPASEPPPFADSSLPSTPRHMATAGDEFPLVCAPQEGIAEACVYQ